MWENLADNCDTTTVEAIANNITNPLNNTEANG